MSEPVSIQSGPGRRNEIALWCIALLLFSAGAAAGIRAASGSPTLHLAGVVLRVAAVLLLVAWAAFLRRKLTPWIVVAMFAGIEIGADAPALAINLHFLSDIFLRLVKTVVAPLILATLVSGIAGHGDLKSVGRMGWKSLLYFEVLTTVALFIGLVAANVSKAGVGMVMPADLAGTAPSAAPMHWQDFLVHVFPENIAKSIAEGQVLQVAVFAAIFGMGLALTPRAKAEPVLRLTESLSEVMFRFTNLVMYMAPLGVASAMAYTVARMGPGVLVHLGKLLLVFYLAMAVFLLCVLLPVALLARLNIRRLLQRISGPVAIAFATASSEAALPRAMEEMEAYGVPAAHSCLCHPGGLLVQSRRLDPVSLDGDGICRAGGECAAQHRPAGVHDGNADARLKGSCRRAARGAGGDAGDGWHAAPAQRADSCPAGHRRADGHGPYRHQCRRKLPGKRRCRPLGGRA